MESSENPTEAVDGGDALYPIRTVSDLTGVNPVTLRAWERRYGLLRPHRTPKGHRLYTRGDIDLINRVVQLVGQGIPISQVRQRIALSTPPASGAEVRPDDAWGRYRQAMLAAVARFDDAALDGTYNEALSLYPLDVVTRLLIMPLLHDLGERWANLQGSVSEEHFFSVFLRNKLGARFHHQLRRRRGAGLVAACLPGEEHEFGLLLFALSAGLHGYRAVLLGADTPLDELPQVARRTEACAIVLSGSVDPPDGALWRSLRDLVHRVEVPVFVGGALALRHHDTLRGTGAVPLGTDIDAALLRIDATLGLGDERPSDPH